MLDLPNILNECYPQDIIKGEDRSFRVSPTRILKCPRGAFMDSIGYKEPLSPQSHQNYEYGIMRHKIIQDQLIKAGLLITAEEEITWDDPTLLGFMDGRLKTDDGEAVLEIKTTAERPNKITEPLYTHGDQCQLYMHMTGLPIAYLLYESKGTKGGSIPWVQLLVKYDKERAERIIQKGRVLLRKLETRTLPAKASDCFCKNPACFNKEVYKKEGLKGFLL